MLGDTDYYMGSSAVSAKSLGTLSLSSLSISHQRGDSIGVDSTEQLNSLHTLTEEVFVFLFYCFIVSSFASISVLFSRWNFVTSCR